MNINSETYIKKEIVNVEGDAKTLLPISELNNITVKNEPIDDDFLPSVTIKNEPLNPSTLMDLSCNIKIEDPIQSPSTVPKNTFVVYKLQTSGISKQIQHVENLKTRQTVNEIGRLNNITNITQLNPLDNKVIQVLAKQKLTEQVITKSNVKNNTISKSTTTSPPVLLNAKLRKRNTVVVPRNPIAKRTRYNIEKATVSAKNLTTGDKKIINHLIKNKRNQNNFDHHTINTFEYSTALKSDRIVNKSKQMQIEMPLMKSIEEPCSNMQESHVNSNAAPKKISNTPELRVKCLCSLTADTTNNTTYTLELRDFFREMFEKTRRLNKKQQRKIKMTLLQAILDAENSVEQGKCCSF